MAKSCIPLTGSVACPAFASASISTDATLTSFFPFLANVSDTKSFDTQLKRYVANGYAQFQYVGRFGCSGINLRNTDDLYAQYTMSYLCNGIIQNSVTPCGLTSANAPPLCASSCADFVASEQRIISTPSLCGSPNSDKVNLLRGDLAACEIPNPSIDTSKCVFGYQNEPDNCGFQSNLKGLCSYCRRGTVNSTDSCCVASDVESRCRNVRLPNFNSMRPVTKTHSPKNSGHSSSSTSTSSTSSAGGGGGGGGGAVASSGGGLSGGQVAGIVIGSAFGAIFLIVLLVFGCIYVRRRSQSRTSTLNQPTPPRSGGAASQTKPPPAFEALPGARVTRMTALEAIPGGSPGNETSNEESDAHEETTSPESRGNGGLLGAAADPEKAKKGEGFQESSPESAGEFSSPDNGGTTQSERMSSFKDYYSAEEIHVGDLVSTLWAYQPRAPDEFELVRGDMLKIVGIWDDGWATGVRIDTRAGDWSPSQRSGRDSVVSNDSPRGEESSGDGDIKAFPLVCVCLPQYWRVTVEGEPSSPPMTD